MIFVCIGTQIYQFNRLLKKLDDLCAVGTITDCVFAQIGASDYVPQHYQYEKFMSEEDFLKMQRKANLIISHGGTGALIGALKLGKPVIAVPRLHKYGEHSDDHQLQVCEVLEQEQYLRVVWNMEELEIVIRETQKNPTTKEYNRPSNILSIIDEFIQNVNQ
ncbi:MAG: PssE/Cps14G family polysaccharide biosynthesis glycosyltransferase [Sedimentibacter saalensis]|uniref:PssE/Cps14G family polysaccharide biosynthesis glycosyltransferase n=1 Tax=Sedimentibacter saalensis TaxID=130788 RepID=UPI002B1EAE49|nr:PssE/Cps14G family polysaccharide biosynthesis glycosyltransferase [Sedimentibacter saalensis]MEA5093488.1 PssE/Cps14G family polysaccharide biosynthesis glycosyltransferase [Sedimentibacter saalensis]